MRRLGLLAHMAPVLRTPPHHPLARKPHTTPSLHTFPSVCSTDIQTDNMLSRMAPRARALLACVAAMLLLASGTVDAATTSGTLGTGVSVAANTETTINYTGLSLVVHTTTASTVTLSSYASVVAAMPTGYSALGFSAEAGFTLAIEGGGELVKAELTTPSLTTTAAALITGSVEAGCLRYDAELDAYSKVDIKSYGTLTKKIVVDLPKAGTYLFAAVSVNAEVPSFYNETRVTSSSSTKFTFPGGFTLDVATSSSNTVSVQRSSFSVRADPESKHNIGAYFDINQGSSSSVTATLQFKYSADLAASVASSLRFAFWNTTASAWQFPSTGASVDTNTRVVSQTTVHFSEWAVFGGGDTQMIVSDQAVSAASPSKCYAVDYDHFLGVMNAEVTKIDGGANLRMYLLKGTSCPGPSNFQMRSELAKADGQSRTICVTDDTTPEVGDGRYMIAVYAEGLSGTGSRTRFSLEVSNDLFCNASPARMAWSAAVALVVLAASYVLA